MAAALTADEEQATKSFIEVVNKLRRRRAGGVSASGATCGGVSWNTAVKFLAARKFDVGRALALYEQHEATRQREGLVHLDATHEPLKSELSTGKFTILPTRDATGAAIAVFTARVHSPQIASHQTTLQGVVYQLDVALESVETQRCGLVFIYDMSDSKYSNFDYDLSQKILTLLKGGYPAKLKKVLIVTAPLWFKAPFRILRLFVREKLRDRVFTVSIPQLVVHIPRECLPVRLGGSLEVAHHVWLLHCHKSMANRPPEDQLCMSPLANDNNLLHQNVDEKRKSKSNSRGNSEDEDEDDLEIATQQQQQQEQSDNNGGEAWARREPGNNSGAVSPLPAASSASSGFSDDDSLHCDGGGGGGGGGVSLEQFVEAVQAKGRQALCAEYAELKARPPQGTFNHAKLRNNLPKNRYTDVLCYDHSRVILSQVDDDPTSDYINANFVDGYKQRNAFISTQGPLPKTCADFWRMIWEQQTLVVVMTTRVMERGRTKCAQYWPEDEGAVAEHGHFTVTCQASEPHPDYVISSLLLTNTKTEESRSVHHYQFTSWPDYGVPHSALAMLDFLAKVRQCQAAMLAALGDTWAGHVRGPPILVHCSAGIGRTGTFCTLDICISRLEDAGTVDVRSTVERIRAQRAFSIQMPDQYVFCHLALIEYALSKNLLPTPPDLATFQELSEESD
ncbi:tyrosine-protein phosphatase non-receptor type 9 [Nilaparvata lugens]|uniref:tyrosine-protein phosphatase non-receptor type 9 n=1 Tax=Nilaparvata lugens TaxID=108931 RepID=UPI00193C9824|nr:tyrosine-protein phosphatase non-receptor type 9 [Nilaparvata lugens]